MMWKWAMAVLWKVSSPQAHRSEEQQEEKDWLLLQNFCRIIFYHASLHDIARQVARAKLFNCIYSLSGSLTWAWIDKVLCFHHCLSGLWELWFWMSNVLNALKKDFHWRHRASGNWAFFTSFVSLSSRYKLDVLVLPYVTEMLWKYVHFYFCSCWMLIQTALELSEKVQ